MSEALAPLIAQRASLLTASPPVQRAASSTAGFNYAQGTAGQVAGYGVLRTANVVNATTNAYTGVETRGLLNQIDSLASAIPPPMLAKMPRPTDTSATAERPGTEEGWERLAGFAVILIAVGLVGGAALRRWELAAVAIVGCLLWWAVGQFAPADPSDDD